MFGTGAKYGNPWQISGDQPLARILSANSVLGVYVVVIFDVRNAEFTLNRLGEQSVLSRFCAMLQK